MATNTASIVGKHGQLHACITGSFSKKLTLSVGRMSICPLILTEYTNASNAKQ
jgi:hypothetical protein